MNTSTTEGAASNKRSRMSVTFATATKKPASGGLAANDHTYLATTLGTRLMPLMGLLATQPDELKGTIISQSREMLELRATIKQRIKSYARFEKPSTDATTGAVIKDRAGNPLPFLPSSLRSKCPIKASTQTNNDPEMVQLLEDAAAAHTEYQLKMTGYAKQTGKLEIKLRQQQLRTKLFVLLETIALAHIIITEVKYTLPTEIKLNKNQLTTKTTFDVLQDSTIAMANLVEAENGNKLAADYATARSFDNTAIEAEMDDADDRVMKPIINKMNTWLPILTVDLWTADDNKDSEHAINAALRKELQPKAMVAANDSVDAAMDVEDSSNPPESLLNFIRKEQKKLGDKQMVMLKRQMRKNYSGDDKNQPLQPTKNGRELKNKSTATASKKKKAKQSNPKKDTKAKSSKKKAEEDKAASPNSNRPPRKNNNKDSRGGSSGGGKKKSAEKR